MTATTTTIKPSTARIATRIAASPATSSPPLVFSDPEPRPALLAGLDGDAVARELADRGPHLAVVLGDHRVAHRHIGMRLARKAPILRCSERQPPPPHPPGAIEPEKLGVAALDGLQVRDDRGRSEEHTSELRHLGISYAVF